MPNPELARAVIANYEPLEYPTSDVEADETAQMIEDCKNSIILLEDKLSYSYANESDSDFNCYIRLNYEEDIQHLSGRVTALESGLLTRECSRLSAKS